MKKNVNLCIDLKTIMQKDAHLSEGQCYRGVLSRTGEEQYLFEEETHRPMDSRGRRNPKLYDGRYISLVHMQNGRYQVHMRTINASEVADLRDLAFSVHSELLDAFSIMD
ncbi:MAG: hypothetical protein IJZ86_09585 [Bacteroides sp.]|nr:hypothetical protein [Bacteroides sp.]